MFVIAESLDFSEMCTEQNQRYIYIALFLHILQVIDCRVSHMFHNSFLRLRFSLSYCNDGMYLLLELCECYSWNKSAAGRDSLYLCIASTEVVTVSLPTVWEALIYPYFLQIVPECHKDKQRAFVTDWIEMRIAIEA